MWGDFYCFRQNKIFFTYFNNTNVNINNDNLYSRMYVPTETKHRLLGELFEQRSIWNMDLWKPLKVFICLIKSNWGQFRVSNEIEID